MIQATRSTLVCKIATVPDVAGLRMQYGLPANLVDSEVTEFVFQKYRAAADASAAPDTLPLHLHRITQISCALQSSQGFRMMSFGDQDEGVLIQRFFALVEQEKPALVFWNGKRFDVPVLNYRGVLHQLSAPTYWGLCGGAQGDGFVDLSQVFARSVPSFETSLSDLAMLCGFITKERCPLLNCESEALLCHLIFLRWQLLSGSLDVTAYANGIQGARTAIAALKD